MLRESLGKILVMVALAGSLSACGSGGQSSSQRVVSGGTVVVRVGGDWGNAIDGGQTVTSAIGGMLAEAMYDRLVEFNYKTGAVIPYLASSWNVAPTSVTFRLASGAACSDGTPVTPTAVYNSFARLISPATSSRWVQTIFGLGPYSISKDDAAGAFTFSTEKPFNTLLQAFAQPWTGIICPEGLRPGANFDTHSYGSGPFVLQSGTHGADYIVAKRAGWKWGPEGSSSSKPGFPDAIDFKSVSNETTAANLLLTGGLDVATVGGPDQTRLSSNSALELTKNPSYAPYTLQINEAALRPGADIVVRQAMLTAVDAKGWNKAAFSGSGVLSTNFQANPGGLCYSDLSAIMPKSSASAAKQILLKAGYTIGSDGKLQKDGKDLTITLVGSTATAGGPEYMANQLEQAGFHVVLNVSDPIGFSQNFSSTKYDILVGQFATTLPVPPTTANFMVGKSPPAGNNRINRADPELDTLVANTVSAPPGPQACAAWKAFNTYVIKNSIALPWVAPVTNWYARKGTFSYSPNGPTLDPVTILRLK